MDLWGSFTASPAYRHWDDFLAAGHKFAVPPRLLAAIAWIESNGGRTSQSYLGVGGGSGPTGIPPAKYAGWHAQIYGAAQTLRSLIDQYGLQGGLSHYGPAGDSAYPGQVLSVEQAFHGKRPHGSRANANSLARFINLENGKALLDSAGAQCVALAEAWLGWLGDPAIPVLNATDFANAPGFHRGVGGIRPGDLAVWATNHVDVFVKRTKGGFLGFDENWPRGSAAHLQAHDWSNVEGYLRPANSPGVIGKVPGSSHGSHSITHWAKHNLVLLGVAAVGIFILVKAAT